MSSALFCRLGARTSEDQPGLMIPNISSRKVADDLESSLARIDENLIDALVEEIRTLPASEKRHWATAAITCFDACTAMKWGDQPERAKRLAMLKFATALHERL